MEGSSCSGHKPTIGLLPGGDDMEVITASGLPLVSCIMPTNNRRRFASAALDYFLRQAYPNRELVIVDDGLDPIADLIPDDARIRYFNIAQRSTIGSKRNFACREAKGDIIVHWDDD